MPLGPHGTRSEAYRPVVAGRKGMVCSGHPLASEAGMAILRRGGNAVDAALAVAAALGVVEPNSSGLGGDGFIMVYAASSKQVRVMNATGPAPARATLDAYASDGIPMKGMRSVSVPGIVSGLFQVHREYGALSPDEDLGPAIELAADGFPLSQKQHLAIEKDPILAEFPSSRAIFTRDGVPLPAGQLLVQRDLAESLRVLGAEGESAYYHGPIAAAIQRCSKQYDGLLSAEDLQSYTATWQEPISVDYRGYRVFEGPPNCSGHVLLQMLNLVEHFDLRSLGASSTESIHLMVEAKKLAFADREAYLADPAFVDVPIDGLISKEYGHERAALIRRDKISTLVSAGNPWPHQIRSGISLKTRNNTEHTTCFVVADRWGNAVCQLQSIQSNFGSGLVAPGTGIVLNNRMTYWHLDPEHVDCLMPGKRVRHTMNPVMVTSGGRLILVCGTPGADTQVQTNLQVVTHVLDHGYDVVEAVEAPRWRNTQNPTESTIPHTCDDELLLEARFPSEVRRGLAQLGHPVREIGPWDASGSEMMIQIDPATGSKFGGADPRLDGYAIGW